MISYHTKIKQARTLSIVALSAMVLIAAGCSEGNPFSTCPVTGKITYEDGKPIEAATVIVHFIPDRAGAVGDKYPQPGQATLSGDGTFQEVSTFSRSDGAITGRHKVVLETMNADFTPQTSAVAQRFTDPTKTPLSIDVKPDGENHFELTVARGP